MKKKESITPDYLYFKKMQGKRNKIELAEREIAGIRILEVCVCAKKQKEKSRKMPEDNKQKIKKQKNRDRFFGKMKKKLRNYELERCVIGASEEMAEELELSNLLFQARKLELLNNRKMILEQLKTDYGKNRRSRMALVVNSQSWNRKELLEILITAKDYYEDIGLVMKGHDFESEQIKEMMYEEWGVVVNVAENEKSLKQQDFMLFLSENSGEKNNSCYSFLKAYEVAENGSIYSGLTYEKQGIRLPHQMAVDIAAQNPMLYKEFRISIVAIWGA